MVRFTLSDSPAPIYMAVSTLVLVDKPRNRLVIRFTREAVEPTAAREFSEAKLPTTIISAALNSSCNTLDSSRGSVSFSSFGKMEP